MSHSVEYSSYLQAQQIESSYATRLYDSKGFYGRRVALDGKDNKVKIAALGIETHQGKLKMAASKAFIAIVEFFDRLLNRIGMGYQQKWIKVTVYNQSNKSDILLNINSLMKRTMLTRQEILSKTPDELSIFLAKPASISFERPRLKDLFPHTLIINLDTKKDRIESLNDHLANIGESDFAMTRVPAIVGKDLDSALVERMERGQYSKGTARDDRPGRMGCYLSHLKALKEARANHYDKVLILEDDVRFLPERFFGSNHVQKAMQELPTDWGMLFLGHYDPRWWNARTYSDHLVCPGRPFDLHAYVVNSSMYDQLIDLLEKELQVTDRVIRPVDVVIGVDLVKTGRVFAMKEHVAIQDEGESAIIAKFSFGNYFFEMWKLRKQFTTDRVIDKETTADGLPVMKPLMAGVLYQMMYHMDQVFQNHGVQYFIQSETLLGAIRQGGVIPHDDRGAVCLLPEMEKLLYLDTFKQDLDALGLGLVPHSLGFTIYVKQEDQLEKIHHCKAPTIDLFTTKQEAIEGEDYLVYANEEVRKLWPETNYKLKDIVNSQGELTRIEFGPITLSAPQKGKKICHKQYGNSCLTEVFLQNAPTSKRSKDRRPVVLTDFRLPHFKQWSGLKPIPLLASMQNDPISKSFGIIDLFRKAIKALS